MYYHISFPIIISFSGTRCGRKKRNYRFNYEEVKNKAYPEDMIKVLGTQLRTIWDIPNNKTRDELKYGKHPTQKPERLISRLMDVSAPDSGIVLVPFAGSGTECVVAKKRKLDYIGIEQEEEYVNIANKRLAAVTNRENWLL